MSGRPILNVSRKAEAKYTEAILSGRIKPSGRSKYLESDNVALRGAATGSKASWRENDSYVPARDNPQDNVRPGADDHKRCMSKGMETQATYHRGHV